MEELRLTSPIPPSVNHYLGYRGVMKKGRPMAMSYTTPEASSYKEAFTKYVVEEVTKQGFDLPLKRGRHFYVDAVFYFDKVSRDCNNYFKVMLDAITDTQLVWPDDNVVCERVQRIYYDADDPRIELWIHPVEYIGVFDNAPQMEAFVSRCVGCRRYKNNCSLLRRAQEGRVQDEIKDGVCAAYSPIKNERRQKNGK